MKPARQRTAKARGCRGCPYLAPSGRCLDPVIRSGRCGDWVWYMWGAAGSCRRLYVKPRDPRTPKQLPWRARFGAASRKYSNSLTDEQRHACVAAGAKLQSRKRLNQSGPLTGQQFSIRMEYAANARARAQSAEMLKKGLQTQGILQPTSDIRRSIPGAPPEHRRWDTGRGRKGEGRRMKEVCGGRQAGGASEVRQAQRVTRSRLNPRRTIPWAMRRHAARNAGAFPVLGSIGIYASSLPMNPNGR